MYDGRNDLYDVRIAKGSSTLSILMMYVGRTLSSGVWASLGFLAIWSLFSLGLGPIKSYWAFVHVLDHM